MIKVNQEFKQGKQRFKIVSLIDAEFILVRNLNYPIGDDMGKPRKMSRGYFLSMVDDGFFVLV